MEPTLAQHILRASQEWAKVATWTIKEQRARWEPVANTLLYVTTIKEHGPVEAQTFKVFKEDQKCRVFSLYLIWNFLIFTCWQLKNTMRVKELYLQTKYIKQFCLAVEVTLNINWRFIGQCTDTDKNVHECFLNCLRGGNLKAFVSKRIQMVLLFLYDII